MLCMDDRRFQGWKIPSEQRKDFMSTTETNAKSDKTGPKGRSRPASFDKKSIFQYDEATMMRDSE